MLEEGRRTFRFDPFGSEDFWGAQLRLHEAIVRQKLGGVGAGVSPKMVLSLGLKVDADALPIWLRRSKPAKDRTGRLVQHSLGY